MGYIVLNSKFKPFSYQEMLAPAMAATEAYNSIEEELGNLDIMASDIAAKLTNNPEDQELRNLYNNFNIELNRASDELSTRGLTPQTRKNLIALKTQYAEKLNPINEAYKAYVEDQKYLDRLAIEHPEIIVEGAGKSISDYMYGKTPQMRAVNTDDLMNQAMAMAKTQAGRTYKQSGWTSTAGGRFLERTTEIGLNDIDFNNALYLIENPGLKASDLGITEAQFNKIKNNANLIEASIDDIINTPDFEKLSPENQRKAMNSIMKGVRAGFQYDKKDNIQSDPMFAYNLKKQEEIDKLKAKKLEQINKIGSDYFYTPDVTKQEYKNKYINTLGKDIGKLKNNYTAYFSKGVLKSIEQIEKEASKMKEDTPKWNTTQSSTMPYSQVTMGGGSDSYRKEYDKLRQAIVDLGLDPNTVTKDEFIEALSGDVRGRKRFAITSNDAGFDRIQTRIEDGLKNEEYVQTIVGLEASTLGRVGNYRTTQKFKYKDLLDKNGKLNMLGINLDPATGQLSAKVKSPKGEYMEILLPDGVGYQADDASDLRNNAFGYSAVSQGMYPVYTKDSNGNPVLNFIPLNNGYIPNTTMLGTDYLDDAEQEMAIMFGDLFNFFGAEDVND